MFLYSQTEPGYVPPVWPASAGCQRMMMHLDFAVSDLESAVQHALSCGAKLAKTQYLDGVKVCIDPAGHPFCLCERK